MDVEALAISLVETFRQVEDPRSSRGKRHPLAAILTQATAAMLCGARSQYAIWQWGRLQPPEVVQAMGFRRNRTPSIAALHHVFAALDAEAFEAALSRWIQDHLPPEVQAQIKAIALDGKQLRGIHGEELPGVRLVAGFTHEMGFVLAQEKGGTPSTQAS
jgi:hypothetical protein